MSGQTGTETDEGTFWLEIAQPGISIRRPIQWEAIVGARWRGKTLEVAELRERAVRYAAQFAQPHAAANSKELPTEPPVEVSAEELPPPVAEQRNESPTPPPSTVPPSTVPPSTVPPFVVRELPQRVASVAFDVRAANWDADVELDGLLLAVYPVDDFGQAVPARGTLQVDLIARQHRPFQTVPRSRGAIYNTIGRWTRQISLSDFQRGGPVVRLPYQAVHPEFDLSTANIGLVNVRLSVPGSGMFESSQDVVRIRPFSPTRDDLQLRRGKRFFPVEQTGRGKRTVNW